MNDAELIAECQRRGGKVGPSIAETMAQRTETSLIMPGDWLVNLKMSEKAFQAAVVRHAKERGWTCYHTFDSRRSQEGFPDIVFRRGPGYAVRLVVAELKVKNRKPTVEQYAWLGAFEMMGIPAFVWYPSDWSKVMEVLA